MKKIFFFTSSICLILSVYLIGFSALPVFKTSIKKHSISTQEHSKISSFSEPVSKTNKDVVVTSCIQDKDCILVLKGCCPCNSGGEYIAIHKSQKTAYKNQLKERCIAPTRCLAWYRCDEWEDKARCIHSKCSVVKKTKT